MDPWPTGITLSCLITFSLPHLPYVGERWKYHVVVGFDYYNQMSLHHISSDTSPDHAPYREVYHYRHDYDQLAVRHASVNGRHVGDSPDYPGSYRGDGGSN